MGSRAISRELHDAPAGSILYNTRFSYDNGALIYGRAGRIIGKQAPRVSARG